jgi:hypothetical protein
MKDKNVKHILSREMGIRGFGEGEQRVKEDEYGSCILYICMKIEK